jgi:hypothetical protein
MDAGAFSSIPIGGAEVSIEIPIHKGLFSEMRWSYAEY